MKLDSMTPVQYNEMVKKASPPSKSAVCIIKAFLIGGGICCLAQLILELYTRMGMDQKTASAFASVTLVLASALLTATGLYQKLARHGGAGTLVPITGFANAVVSSALEFRSEGFVTGLGAKIFIISGPVILYGTAASVLYGLIYYFFIR